MSKSASHAFVLAVITTLLMAGSPHADGAEQGTAVVRAVTLPPVSSGSVRFTGTPAGQKQLDANGTASLATELAIGRHVSTLAWISPELQSQGYVLTAITCDDPDSHGDLVSKSAMLELKKGKTATCIFQLSATQKDDGDSQQPGEPGDGAEQPPVEPPGDTREQPPGGVDTGRACTCPSEGRWAVVNHTGSMACTGAMSMTLPLKASRGSGRLEIRDGCATVHASGMGDDEADIDMYRQKDCSYAGKVGGERDGIPMIIRFHWKVKNSNRITGDLKSTVSQSGMTCKMSRTYELDYQGASG